MTLSDDDIIRTIPDDLPFGIWVARCPGGETVHANAAFDDIMGTGVLDEVGVGAYAAPYGIHGRDGELYPEDQMPFVRAVRAKGTVTVDDIVIHRRDGRRVFIRATAKAVLDSAGAVTHVVIAFIDITREVVAEQELRRKERMESVGKLAGGIAHDFNNLLASVRGIASMLLVDERDDRRRADLLLIDEAAASGAALTRALLDYSRRRPAKVERVQLNVAARSVLSLLARSVDRRITFDVELRSQSDLAADLAMLEQVVMNLVVNACEAMPDGGRVHVRTFDLANEDGTTAVALEVADSGPGIDPSILERIFEPYTTTKADASKRGAGLGLATVFGIVASHAGSVAVHASSPAGTTMRVTLPALPPGPRRVAQVARAAAEPPQPGSGLVLVVDDEAVVREITRRQLQSLGYTAVAVADGHEAIEAFERLQHEISGVVLDMNMPGLCGLDVLRALRTLQPAVRVLVVSGNAATDEELAVIRRNGAFLEKPWSVAELSQAFASLKR